MVDLSAPNDYRIIRDHAYLTLASADDEIEEAADACFVHEPHIRAQYVSGYKRAKAKRYRDNKKAKNAMSAE